MPLQWAKSIKIPIFIALLPLSLIGQIGGGGGAGGGGSTTCPGSTSGTANSILTDTGAGKCQDTLGTIDSSGNFSTPGGITSGAGTTVPGQFTIQANSGTPAAIPPNSFGFGPMPATYTNSLLLQPPNTSPSNSVMVVSAPSGNVAPWTWTGITGSGTFCMTTGCAMALSNLATQAADTVVLNATGGAAAPTAVAMPTSGTNGCAGASNAVTYNTTTHAFGCNSISASGTAGTNISITGGVISVNPFDTTQVPLFNTGFCNGGTAAGSANTFQGDGWIFSLTNAGTLIQPVNSANTDQNHPCGVKLLAPASISNGMYMAFEQNGPNATTPNIFASGTFVAMEMQAQVKLSATTDMRFNWGWSSAASIPTNSGSQGCGIRYDTTFSDTVWTAWCGDGTTTTATNMTGTLDTNIHRLRMWQTAQGTVNFSVDGGVTTSITTHISSTAARTWAPKFWISNDGTSTTSQLDVFRAVGQFTGLTVN